MTGHHGLRCSPSCTPAAVNASRLLVGKPVGPRLPQGAWPPSSKTRLGVQGFSGKEYKVMPQGLAPPAMGAKPGRATVHCWSSVLSTVLSIGATMS